MAPAASRASLALLASSLRAFSRMAFGGAVHQLLGLLETEVGERAHLLDDLDLLVAGGGRG